MSSHLWRESPGKIGHHCWIHGPNSSKARDMSTSARSRMSYTIWESFFSISDAPLESTAAVTVRSNSVVPRDERSTWLHPSKVMTSDSNSVSPERVGSLYGV
jgi:hypothetical protein